MQEVYPAGFNRGFTETFDRYGVLLDRLAMGVVNGFTYHQPQPFDMPGPNGPMSPDEIGAEFGRRLDVAAGDLQTKLWRQDLADWDSEWKPRAIARHLKLSGVDLTSLDTGALVEHLEVVAAHVTEMVYQHHRFNMAAILPVGDFVLHASAWTGRPPHTLLGVMNGHSSISATLPDEMRPAIAAIRSTGDAQELVRGDGDAAQRIADLRAMVPAVDDFLRIAECRLIDGFDLVNPTLREQPEIVLGKFSAALDALPDEARHGADVLAKEIRSEVPVEHLDFFDELLEDSRATIGCVTSAASTARSRQWGSSV